MAERNGPAMFEQVERLLLEALQVSRAQQAKSQELRSSVALGKLWLRQDKRAQARELVVSVYDWFTEGFDTPDLKTAKAGLSEPAGLSG